MSDQTVAKALTELTKVVNEGTIKTVTRLTALETKQGGFEKSMDRVSQALEKVAKGQAECPARLGWNTTQKELGALKEDTQRVETERGARVSEEGSSISTLLRQYAHWIIIGLATIGITVSNLMGGNGEEVEKKVDKTVEVLERFNKTMEKMEGRMKGVEDATDTLVEKSEEVE